jgi:CheY-like chemotaxis protein
MGSKPIVVIAEDQKINREILKGILRQDFEVVEAENGQVALDILKSRHDVSAILLDLVMPVMDGYALLAELRKPPFSTIPAIAVTGSVDDGTEQKVLDLGARDFVTKPYQPMTLLTRLKNAIAVSHTLLLGQSLLESIEGPAGVFSIQGDLVKNLGYNQQFLNFFCPGFEIDLSLAITEQNCFTPADIAGMKGVFASCSKATPSSSIKLSLVCQKEGKANIVFVAHYWGEYNGAKIVIAHFESRA